MTSQEGEALSLLAQQTGSQVTMTDTYLAVVSHRTGDAESLQTDTDSLGSISSIRATLLQSDGATYYISPLGVLKTDHLRLFAGLVRIQASCFADGISLFDVLDTIFVQGSENLLHSAVLALKFHFSNHIAGPPYYSLRGSIDLTIPCSGFVRP